MGFGSQNNSDLRFERETDRIWDSRRGGRARGHGSPGGAVYSGWTSPTICRRSWGRGFRGSSFCNKNILKIIKNPENDKNSDSDLRFQLPNNLDLTFEFNSQTPAPAYRDAAAATRSRSAPVSGTTTRRTALDELRGLLSRPAGGGAGRAARADRRVPPPGPHRRRGPGRPRHGGRRVPRLTASSFEI